MHLPARFAAVILEHFSCGFQNASKRFGFVIEVPDYPLHTSAMMTR